MCVWVEDADKLEMNSRELNIVFENRAIHSFLYSNSSLGLAGIKGQGKTFLIKVKRKILSTDPSVVCLPNSRMVDIIDSSLLIDRSLYNYLIDYNVWVDLWKFAICGTIITSPQVKELFKIDEMHIKSSTKKILKLNNTNSEAGFLVKNLLYSNISEFKSLIEDTGRLFDYVKNIHQSVCLFFDKLDQGFSKYAKNFNADIRLPNRSRNASFWQYAQYSLAEAAYDIYTNTAHHIKVYFTIRQEALIDSEYLNKDKVRNINGYITILEYTKSNLKEMYQMYIENEEDKNLVEADCKLSDPSKAFLGIDTLVHGYIPDESERVFDYIYRHSFKRPYDIMKICRTLYFSEETTVKGVRHIVNRVANELLSIYLHELETFLPCRISEIERLIQMLPGNILNLELMKSICDTFNFENEPEELWQCNQDCSTCESLQPFSILYNLGLIGYLRRHEADEHPYEEFENIGKSILELNAHTLPVSKLYFLHPALSNKARDCRNRLGLSFEMNHFLLVGDKCPVRDSQSKKAARFIKKCNDNFRKERIFISSTINDLAEERRLIRNYMKSRGLHPIMSDYNDFDLSGAQLVHSHDCCLDEILKCKSFLFIIGKEYGGYYSGEKYQKEKEEILTYSQGKIKKPSISLMEYYVARKYKLKCYAFIHKSIDETNYKQGLSQEMRDEINFLTHFSIDGKNIQGNWISRYDSVHELLLLLKNVKFV